MKLIAGLAAGLISVGLAGCAGLNHGFHGELITGHLVKSDYQAHGTIHKSNLDPRKLSIIYQRTQGSLSYPSPTVQDLRGPVDFADVIEVEGEACERHFFIPLSMIPGQRSSLPNVDVTKGDKGYELARKRAQQDYGVEELFDLRVDVHDIEYYNVYKKECLVIHALGLKKPTLFK
jgi:hypothetical protein